ncbi:MAG: hypothetical protein V2A71_00815, partial [Candidatus Eisenbacteria bacterium]
MTARRTPVVQRSFCAFVLPLSAAFILLLSAMPVVASSPSLGQETGVRLERALRPSVEVPRVVFPELPFDATVRVDGAAPEDSFCFSLRTSTGRVIGDGVLAGNGVTTGIIVEDVTLHEGEVDRLLLEVGEAGSSTPLHTVPGVLSILPPLLAIALAILTRQVVVSLFLGIWLGATFIYGYSPWTALLRSIDGYAVDAASDASHVSIIIFSLLLGGMVGVISKSGGTQGIVDVATPVATSARRGQLATWIMGILIFFDDYANTLIVGNT